jgi:hypothetical protein
MFTLSQTLQAKIYCRHLSTPDNSALIKNFVHYDFYTLSTENQQFALITIYSKNFQTGKISFLNREIEKVSIAKKSNVTTIRLASGKRFRLLQKDNRLIKRRNFSIRDLYAPSNIIQYQQDIDCTTNKSRLDLLNIHKPMKI